MIFLLFAVGIAVLVLGAWLFVEGAVTTAVKIGVSQLAIGLTVVSFGTSAPELAVNLIAALRSAGDISFGNIVGSNTFNILAVLGFSALVRHLPVGKSTMSFEIPLCLGGALALGALYTIGSINRVSGAILLTVYGLFLVFALREGLAVTKELPLPSGTRRSMPVAGIMLLLGLVALVAGGHLVVESAVSIAERLDISQRVIAVTVVAAGTSLPEVATSIMAAIRGEIDIAVGNAVGSCIINVFFILGVTSLVTPITIPVGALPDIAVYGIAGTLLLFFALTPRPGRLHRIEGMVMLTVYVLYLAVIL